MDNKETRRSGDSGFADCPAMLQIDSIEIGASSFEDIFSSSCSLENGENFVNNCADAEADDLDQATASEIGSLPYLMPAGYGNYYGPRAFPDAILPHPEIPTAEIPDHPLTYEEIVNLPGFGFKPFSDYMAVPVCLITVPDSTQGCGFRTEFVNGISNAFVSIKRSEDGVFHIPEELGLGLPPFVSNPTRFMGPRMPAGEPEHGDSCEPEAFGSGQVPETVREQSQQFGNRLPASSVGSPLTFRQIRRGGRNIEITVGNLAKAHGSFAENPMPFMDSLHLAETKRPGPDASSSDAVPELLTKHRDTDPTSLNGCTLTARQARRQLRMTETRSRRQKQFCTFCKSNSETRAFYNSHQTKDDNGRVTCPILSKLICPLCGATEEEAHTKKYCPVFLARQAEMTEEEIQDKMKEPQYAYRVARNAAGNRKKVIRYI